MSSCEAFSKLSNEVVRLITTWYYSDASVGSSVDWPGHVMPFVRVCCVVASGGAGLVAKSCLTLATQWTVARQAHLSMGFSRREYWSGLPFPSPGLLPNPGIEPMYPALQAHSLPTEL